MSITPKPVKSVVVIDVNKQTNRIRFVAVEETVEAIKRNAYGSVRYDDETGEYELAVSPLYAFEDVADWLEEQAA